MIYFDFDFDFGTFTRRLHFFPATSGSSGDSTCRRACRDQADLSATTGFEGLPRGSPAGGVGSGGRWRHVVGGAGWAVLTRELRLQAQAAGEGANRRGHHL